MSSMHPSVAFYKSQHYTVYLIYYRGIYSATMFSTQLLLPVVKKPNMYWQWF